MNFYKIRRINFYILVLVTALQMGCQSAPILMIDASVPSRVENKGQQVCSSTPCSIQGYHYRDGYNWGCVKGDDNYLEVFPLSSNEGYRQSKVVYSDCQQVIDVYFDMNSGGLLNVIQKSSDDIESKLSKLQRLKDQGLISDEEYRLKRADIIENYK